MIIIIMGFAVLVFMHVIDVLCYMSVCIVDEFVCKSYNQCAAGGLMFLNEATLLHNLRVRYEKSQIYVSFSLFLSSFHPLSLP